MAREELSFCILFWLNLCFKWLIKQYAKCKAVFDPKSAVMLIDNYMTISC
jgi:hypothetical protein